MGRRAAIAIIIIAVITLVLGIWPIALPLLAIGVFFLYKNAKKQDNDKEKELLRKQNEILLHLIQDEHREEGR